jgi:uncharacterized repeat protein (TIGR04076 family)
MSKAYNVRMTIESIDGTCPNGHKVGEEYLVGGKSVAGICMGSFNACAPYLTALRFGASFPWEKEEGAASIGCPDHINQVVWRLERVEG